MYQSPTMKNTITNWDDVPVVVDITYVANLLRFSTERVRQLCVSGEIPAVKIGGLWRISKQALMATCKIKDND